MPAVRGPGLRGGARRHRRLSPYPNLNPNPDPNLNPNPDPNPDPNPNQVHVDIDAYKSASIFTKLAKAAVGMVYPHVAKLTIDLAFMMAALTEDELPERIIGAARLQS